MRRGTRPGDVDAYLAEARILAGLDHPHIVPVYDADATPDGSPYVVSKYIEGSDLRQRLDLGRPALAESAGLVAAGGGAPPPPPPARPGHPRGDAAPHPPT